MSKRFGYFLGAIFLAASSSTIIWSIKAGDAKSTEAECRALGEGRYDCLCEAAMRTGSERAVQRFVNRYPNAGTVCNAMASTALKNPDDENDDDNGNGPSSSSSSSSSGGDPSSSSSSGGGGPSSSGGSTGLNNGHGNGDQGPPGSSGPHNNAENSQAHSGQGNSAGGRGNGNGS